MFGRTLTGLACLALLCLPACKADTDSGGSGVPKDQAPETFAKELCSAYYDCACDDAVNNSPFTSQENCEAEIEAAIQADVDRADEAELFYDSTCARTALDYLDGLECTAWGDLSLEELGTLTQGVGCKVFYGTDDVGDSCESINNNSDDTCVQDATCEMGTCAAIDVLPDPGDSCDQAFSLCTQGAICIDIAGGTDNACELLPDIGETCLGTADLCAIGLACDQSDKTCQLAPDDGEACAPPAISQCADGLYCDTDTCAPKPTGGEACMPSPGCGEGFTCNAGTCVTDPAVICTYTLGAL
jgi:hypothetical protein